MRRLLTSTAVGVVLLCTGAAASEPDDKQDEPAQTEGILPLPDFGGDLWTRTYLLGDLEGARSDLAKKGLQFGIEWTQTLQGVVDGGRDRTTRYGGSLDFNLHLDLARMGIMPGALINFRAESRYGHSVNEAAGQLLPANTDGSIPLTSPADEEIAFTITSLNYMQFLSHEFAVIVGKIDTFDGDLNEFASGRGVTQFQNFSLNFNPVASLTVPYSTLAMGVVWMPTPEVQVSSTVMNAVDSSTTTGFSDIGEGWLWSSELRFQYRLGDRPGGQTIGVLYAGDSDFLKLGGHLVFRPGEGLSVPTKNETWYVSWNGWQYLWTEEVSDAPINLMNRVPDLQGVGLFARAGVADEDTNPVDWSVSAGVGGRGIIPGRDDDIYGIGYYYYHLNLDRLTGVGAIDPHTHGVEAFYNIALTPAASLTLNLQVIEDAFPATDTAVLLGARFHLEF